MGLNGLLLFLVPILPDTSSTSLLEITVKVASTISSFIANMETKKGQNFHAGLLSASAEEQKNNNNNSDHDIPHKLLDGYCSYKASFHVIGARQRQWHVVCVFIRNHFWIWFILHFFEDLIFNGDSKVRSEVSLWRTRRCTAADTLFPPFTAQQGHIITALIMSFSEEQMYLWTVYKNTQTWKKNLY